MTRSTTHTAPDGDEAVAAAWRLLLGGSDGTADRITLALFEWHTELYARHGPELRLDVRETTREVVRVALLIMSGHGSRAWVSPKQLWRDTGRRRARQGVPLELVMNSFAMGSRMLWEALVARSALGDPAVEPVVLLDAGRRLWTDLDVINEVVIAAYRREHGLLQRRDQQREQAVLDALLEGRAGDPELAEEARTVLGIGAEDGVACVVALLDDASPEGFGLIEDRLDRIGVQTRWHVRSGTYLGLLWGELPDEEGLVALLSVAPPGRLGVACSAGGVAGFASAHLLATRAAATLSPGTREAVSVTGRLPQVLLAGSPQVSALLAEAVAPLLALPGAQGATLLETLAALLRHDGSPTHAAEELYCHRNTVIYRLKQIEQLTGRSLARPADKMLLTLAVLATGRT